MPESNDTAKLTFAVYSKDALNSLDIIATKLNDVGKAAEATKTILAEVSSGLKVRASSGSIFGDIKKAGEEIGSAAKKAKAVNDVLSDVGNTTKATAKETTKVAETISNIDVAGLESARKKLNSILTIVETLNKYRKKPEVSGLYENFFFTDGNSKQDLQSKAQRLLRDYKSGDAKNRVGGLGLFAQAMKDLEINKDPSLIGNGSILFIKELNKYFSDESGQKYAKAADAVTEFGKSITAVAGVTEGFLDESETGIGLIKYLQNLLDDTIKTNDALKELSKTVGSPDLEKLFKSKEYKKEGDTFLYELDKQIVGARQQSLKSVQVANEELSKSIASDSNISGTNAQPVELNVKFDVEKAINEARANAESLTKDNPIVLNAKLAVSSSKAGDVVSDASRSMEGHDTFGIEGIAIAIQNIADSAATNVESALGLLETRVINKIKEIRPHVLQNAPGIDLSAMFHIPSAKDINSRISEVMREIQEWLHPEEAAKKKLKETSDMLDEWEKMAMNPAFNQSTLSNEALEGRNVRKKVEELKQEKMRLEQEAELGRPADFNIKVGPAQGADILKAIQETVSLIQDLGNAYAKSMTLPLGILVPTEKDIRKMLSDLRASINSIAEQYSNGTVAKVPIGVTPPTKGILHKVIRDTQEILKTYKGLTVKVNINPITKKQLNEMLAPAQELLSQLSLVYNMSAKQLPISGGGLYKGTNFPKINERTGHTILSGYDINKELQENDEIRKAVKTVEQEGKVAYSTLKTGLEENLSEASKIVKDEVKKMGEAADASMQKANDTANSIVMAGRKTKQGLDQMIRGYTAVTKAQSGFGKSLVGDVYKPVGQYYRQFVDPMRKMRAEAQDTTSALFEFGKAIGLFYGAKSAIGWIKDAVVSANQFGLEIRRIQSLATNFDYDKLFNNLIQLDARMGNVIHNARTLYWAYSSGVRGTEEELVKFTDVISKTAITIQADAMPTMNAATTLMNAYNLTARDSAEVGDLLFTIIKEGKASAGQLVSSLGNIVSTASATNTSLDELGASIATLTRTIGTNKALTYLNNIMGKLINPTNDVREAAAQLGIELSAASVRAKGFAGVMKEIHDATGGDIGLIAKIFPDLRSQRAALTLLSTQYEEFLSQLQKFKNKGGNMQEALGIITDSPEANYRALINAMTMVKIQAGKAVTSILTLGGSLTKVAEAFNSMSAESKKGVGNMIAGLGTMIALTAAQKAFAAAQVVSANQATTINLALIEESKNKLDILASDRKMALAEKEIALAQEKQNLLSREANDQKLQELKTATEQAKEEKKIADLRAQNARTAIAQMVAQGRIAPNSKTDELSRQMYFLGELQKRVANYTGSDERLNEVSQKEIFSVLREVFKNMRSRNKVESTKAFAELMNPQSRHIAESIERALVDIDRLENASDLSAGEAERLAQLKRFIDEFNAIINLSDELLNKNLTDEEAQQKLSLMVEKANVFNQELNNDVLNLDAQTRSSITALLNGQFEQLRQANEKKLSQLRNDVTALKNQIGAGVNEEEFNLLKEQYNAAEATIKANNAALEELQYTKEQGYEQDKKLIAEQEAGINVQKRENQAIEENIKRLDANAQARIRYVTATKGAAAGRVAAEEEIKKMNDYLAAANYQDNSDEAKQIRIYQKKVDNARQRFEVEQATYMLMVKQGATTANLDAQKQKMQQRYNILAEREYRLRRMTVATRKDENRLMLLSLKQSGLSLLRYGLGSAIGYKLGPLGSALSMLPLGDLIRGGGRGFVRAGAGMSGGIARLLGGSSAGGMRAFEMLLAGKSIAGLGSVNIAAVATALTSLTIAAGAAAGGLLALWAYSKKGQQWMVDNLFGGKKARQLSEVLDARIEQLKEIKRRGQEEASYLIRLEARMQALGNKAMEAEIKDARQNLQSLFKYWQNDTVDAINGFKEDVSGQSKGGFWETLKDMFKIFGMTNSGRNPELLYFYDKNIAAEQGKEPVDPIKAINEVLNKMYSSADAKARVERISKYYADSFIIDLNDAESDAFSQNKSMNTLLARAEERSRLAYAELPKQIQNLYENSTQDGQILQGLVSKYEDLEAFQKLSQEKQMAEMLEQAKLNVSVAEQRYQMAKAARQLYQESSGDYNESSEANQRLKSEVEKRQGERDELAKQFEGLGETFRSLSQNAWSAKISLQEMNLKMNEFNAQFNTNRASFATALLGSGTTAGNAWTLDAMFKNLELKYSDIMLIRSTSEAGTEKEAQAVKAYQDEFLKLVEFQKNVSRQTNELIRQLDNHLATTVQGAILDNTSESMKLRYRMFDALPENGDLIYSQNNLANVIAHLNSPDSTLVEAIHENTLAREKEYRHQVTGSTNEQSNYQREVIDSLNGINNGVNKQPTYQFSVINAAVGF